MDNINFPNNDLKTEVNICISSHSASFTIVYHTYQQLYHAFYQQPSHHQEGMDGDGRSKNLKDEEEESEASDLKAEEAVVGVVKEAADVNAKEI